MGPGNVPLRSTFLLAGAFCNANSASRFRALDMALLKSLVVLSAWSLVEGLAPGDCAFVGIYSDDDDFALVLMEDVDGESISLTEGSPADADFHIDHWAAAKHYVSDSKKGSVLKRSDFQTDSASFLAPMALSAFKGSAESPTVLCSIILESRPVARKLQSVVMLSSMETAEYSGPTSGSKMELLEEISKSTNWLQSQRRLTDFSIASGNATTVTVTTTVTESTESTESTETESSTEESNEENGAAGAGSMVLGAFMVLAAMA